MINSPHIPIDPMRDIISRLSNLEKHIINLILPMQEINQIFRNPAAIENLIARLNKPILIDDRPLRNLVNQLADTSKEFKEDIKNVDLKQTLNEIKYIGNRLDKIEKMLEEMHNNGINQNINLDFQVDGYQLVKKPKNYEPEAPIEKPDVEIDAVLNSLTNREARVLIFKLGLFNQKKLSYSEIGKVMRVTTERARDIFTMIKRKLNHRDLRELVMKTNNKDLKKLVS